MNRNGKIQKKVEITNEQLNQYLEHFKTCFRNSIIEPCDSSLAWLGRASEAEHVMCDLFGVSKEVIDHAEKVVLSQIKVKDGGLA